MMTPKEKAKELSIKMCSPLDMFKPNFASNRKALIAVDEILDENGMVYHTDGTRAYWEEVKEEIENL